jgi:hypothetical protein
MSGSDRRPDYGRQMTDTHRDDDPVAASTAIEVHRISNAGLPFDTGRQTGVADHHRGLGGPGDGPAGLGELHHAPG